METNCAVKAVIVTIGGGGKEFKILFKRKLWVL